jgi:hypothetical protein
MILAGETEVLGENLPSATLSTTNPTWIALTKVSFSVIAQCFGVLC